MNNKNKTVMHETLSQPADLLPAAGWLEVGRQPLLGILGLLAMMAVSWLVIGAFDGGFFATWVTFAVVVAVPVQIVLAMVWQTNYPGWVARLGQPAKGLALLALTAIGAAIIGLLVFSTQGRQVGPPTPFTLMYVIFSVLVTFWLVIVWRCWPLSAFSRRPLVIGLGTLLLAYLGGYVLFAALFDFSAMAGAPFYREAMDPHGAFPAFEALAFAVTSVAVIFALVLLDFWPLSRVQALGNGSLMGLATSLLVLVLTALLYGIGTRWLGLEPVKFMVHGSIALLFGALIPLLMFEGKLFAERPQPLRGLLQLGIAVLAGATLPALYWSLGPLLSGPLQAGGPGYEHELWLASALLAMTFPLLVVFGQFLDFWPLRRR